MSGRKLGTWDPRTIDLKQDAVDWKGLSDAGQESLLRLTSLCLAGEVIGALDVRPLIQVIAEEGRIEEELYLSSFLLDEARHVETFRRFFDEVAPGAGDLSRFRPPAYLRLLGEELPAALQRLRSDPSPVAQAEAAATCTIIVEGVLAETGGHACHALLERDGVLPGMQEAVAQLGRDQSHHLAYGVFLLSRLVAEHGEPVWGALQARMESLLPVAVGVISDTFAACAPRRYGLDAGEFTAFATARYRQRLTRIEGARGRALEQVLREFPAEGI